MSERNAIFREVALERLSSPERLDALMQVVTPRAWLAWAPLAAIVVAALVWSIFGAVSTTVSGRAILLQRGGLAEVSAAAQGRVTEVLVSVGDRIERGRPVVRIAQPELDERRRQAEDRLGELQRQETRLKELIGRGTALGDASLAQQRVTIAQQIKAGEDRIALLVEREASQVTLLEQGLITRQTLLNTRSEITGARLDLENLRGQLKQLELKRLETQRQAEAELRAVQGQIGEARRATEGLVETGRLTTVVESAHAGRVVEVKVGPGMLVSVGMPLVTVESEAGTEAGLEAAIYVAAGDGKKIQPGMAVNLAPSTVRREEFGYLVAEVTYVSDYPATTQSMRLTLQNEDLVRQLSGAAPPIEVRARLLPAKNFSGLRWSTPEGPPVRITAGTLAQADLVVRRQAPITLVIPALRQALGVH